MHLHIRSALACLGLALVFSNTLYAGEYEGTWLLKDTQGGGYEAIINKDGTAAGTHGDAMKHGTWKEVGDVLVISWTTGWTTKISKQANGEYLKSSFKPGVDLNGTPSDKSEAKKKN